MYRSDPIFVDFLFIFYLFMFSTCSQRARNMLTACWYVANTPQPWTGLRMPCGGAASLADVFERVFEGATIRGFERCSRAAIWSNCQFDNLIRTRTVPVIRLITLNNEKI